MFKEQQRSGLDFELKLDLLSDDYSHEKSS